MVSILHSWHAVRDSFDVEQAFGELSGRFNGCELPFVDHTDRGTFGFVAVFVAFGVPGDSYVIKR